MGIRSVGNRDVQASISNLSRGYKTERVLELFESTNWVKSGTAGTVGFDSNGKLMVTAVDTDTTAINSTSINLDLKSAKALRLRFHVDNHENVDKLQFYLFNDSSNSVMLGVYNKARFQTGWNELLLDPTLFELISSGTFQNKFTRMRVTVRAVSGKQTTFIFHSLKWVDSQRPQLMFVFDDGWSSQYTEAFSRIRAAGFVGSIAVISGVIGTPSYMTLAQIQEMYKYGWDMLNHTHGHTDLTTIDSDTIRNELAQCTNYLNTNGMTRASNIVAYPFGSINSNVLQAMQLYRAGRAVTEGIMPAPPPDRYWLKAFEMTKNTAVSTITDKIDEMIRVGGSLILFGHKLVDTAAYNTEYTKTDFQSIVDYVYSKRDQLDVVSVSEWLDKCGL